MAQATRQQTDTKQTQQPKPAKPAVEQISVVAAETPVAEVAQARVDAHALTPRNMLALQRTVGNRQVARMVAPKLPARMIQAKLSVNAPSDTYEQEADKVAAQVMTMRAPENESLVAQRQAESHEAGCGCVQCSRVQRSEEQHGLGCGCSTCGRVQRATQSDSQPPILQRRSAQQAGLAQTTLRRAAMGVTQAPAVAQRSGSEVIQRHSSWEHQSLGDADPKDLAQIGAWQDLIEQTKEVVKEKGTFFDTKGPKQEEAVVQVPIGEAGAMMPVKKGDVMHILAQELNRLDAWQTAPPLQGSTGAIDPTYQTVLVEIPGGGKDADTPLIVTYGELNTMADYYGNIEAMKTAERTIRWRIVQSVRKETFLRLRDIYNQLDKSLTNTEKNDANVKEAKKALQSNKINKDWTNQFMFADSMQLDYISGVVGQVNLVKKSGTGAQSQTDNYAATLARNACHFVPESWHAWSNYHQKAREKALEAWDFKQEIDGLEMRLLTPLFDEPVVETEEERKKNEGKLKELQQKSDKAANEAILNNGFGDHYLQDSYASGHMINKTLIMKWFVEWLDTRADKMDFASDESWRKVQAIAYKQPELAKAMNANEDQYQKSEIQGYDPQQTQNKAQNPQAVEDIQGAQGQDDWMVRFKALGLQIPASLQDPQADTRKLTERWQLLAATDDGQTLSGEQLLAIGQNLGLGELRQTLNHLLQDGIIYLESYDAAQGKKILKDNFGISSSLPEERFKAMSLVLRDGYVPKDVNKFKAAQVNSHEKADDTSYQRMAAMVTYQDYFEFMNNGYMQKSTNALHNKFCEIGLTITSGDGTLTDKVYGDDNMFNQGSSAGVKHSGETAHMSRDAIRNVIDTGADKGVTTARILERLPTKVDGVDIAVWHNAANGGALQNYCNTKVFPNMDVLDKAVGAMGDLTPYLSKDQAHKGEAF